MILNEHDAYAAAWLRNLFPTGTVDERDIQEINPQTLAGHNRVHLFAGVGGWELALQLAGWPQEAEVWTGSCPCQPFSAAGKGEAEKDARHLWPEMFRLIRECQPPVIFGEQVASKAAMSWLDGVCADLEREGYAVGAADMCAASAGEEAEGWIVRGDQADWERIIVGAPHIRQRLFWVAIASGERFGRKHSLQLGQRQDRPEAPGRCTVDGLPNASGAGDKPQRRGKGQASVVGGGTSHGASMAKCICGGTGVIGGFPSASPAPEVERSSTGHGSTRELPSGPEGHAVSGGLPDATIDGRGQRPAISRGSGGRVRTKGDGSGPTDGGNAGGLSDAEVSRRRKGQLQAKKDGQRPDDSGGLGEPEAQGQSRIFSGHEQGLSKRARIDGSGAWSNFRIIPCTDNKARRVGRGLQCLADGIPSRSDDPRMEYLLSRLVELGHSPKAARGILREARANRVGRLRGFGNAIVPQLAAMFVRSVMEIL